MLQLRKRLTTGYVALRKSNIFRSTKSSENNDNGYELKNEIVSTRLFICLLLISFVILVIYTSQVPVTHTIIINTPPLSVYLSHYEKYSETLTCPCSNIAIAQEKFISLTPTFHQICKSDFVKINWLSYLNGASTYLLSSDFRVTGGVLFQILTSFCRLARDAINKSLPEFYSTRFISNNIEFFFLTTANEFISSFDFVRNATFVNGLVSGLLTNFDFQIVTYNPDLLGYRINKIYKYYKGSDWCDCVSTPTCVSPSVIHDNITGGVIFVVPGLYTGCLLVEAMRQSNLQCLYNQTCLNQIQKYIQSPMPFNATPLNTFVPSRYNTSTNIGEILANLMVEFWIRNISYPVYYDQCRSMQCTYTKVGKNSVTYIITALLGLFGGLYKSLYFLTPFIVKIIRRRRGKINSTVVPEVQRSKLINGIALNFSS
jgi:hypothetical protein